ncbi:MAG: 1-deoxy-D-xylulose-5-phosphate reductoisomerase, partial [Clostridiaceae bacterium]|nr:1-deoxy-D-xylulose-5-phosphate reductoisomerase [Clostridiaceae bacterium]
VIAQLGLPDMKLPIQYALTYPERLPTGGEKLSLASIGDLTFYKPDTEKFKCLKLAARALNMGDSACVVLNGANEEAVRLFLSGKISFLDIGNLIEKTLDKHKTVKDLNINDVADLDRWSRDTLLDFYKVGCCN